MHTTPHTPQKPRTRRARPDVKVLADLRQQFVDAGITYTGWAKANAFDRQTVVDVLHGRRAGHTGEAHRVAVALGLKKGQVVSVKLFKPAAKPARAARSSQQVSA